MAMRIFRRSARSDALLAFHTAAVARRRAVGKHVDEGGTALLNF
jgi:hypothetical protein